MPIEQNTQTEFNKGSCRWCAITSMFTKLHAVIGSPGGEEKTRNGMNIFGNN